MSQAPLPPLATRPRPVLLAILDGWGCGDTTAGDNAIARAKTPNWDYLAANFPMGTLNASAHDVGLPEGQMGNSEVGHMNIGSGRVVLQDLPRIDKALADGSVASLPAFTDFVTRLKQQGSGVCHLMGLLSPGGVHSHQSHMAALALLLAKVGVTVHIHAFLDGRDTPPKSALEYLAAFETAIAPAGDAVRIATVSGRYYSMDRDKRWDRVALAYNAIVSAEGLKADNAATAIETSYATGKTDEFVLPAILTGYAGMRDGDGIFMANFRADRARQLLSALITEDFDGFERSRIVKSCAVLGMVEYASVLTPYHAILFPPESITGTLGETVATAGMRQLRIAETEKYAHVTFFLNAGQENEYPGESRILIPSPKVATYDLKPEMSAYEVTQKLEEAIVSGEFDLIVVNYANPDMVGHTGNIEAAIKAVETVDDCLGRLMKSLLPANGMLVVTADHGNIEQMENDATGQAHTAHTLSLVPFITAHAAWEGHAAALPEGKLCDVAPTLLHVMGLRQPDSMTGVSRLQGCLEPAHA